MGLRRTRIVMQLKLPHEDVGGLFVLHKGVEYTAVPTEEPDLWTWRFQIGDIVKTGKVNAKLKELAIRRVQLRIDRALKGAGKTP
jgi:hypothetical protein